MLEAVCVVAHSSPSLAVRHALSTVCTALRATAKLPMHADRVRRCFEQAHACVTRVVNDYCVGALTRERMLEASLAEAVGAIQVHGVSVDDLMARGWGWEYARLRHMCTLIVAGAVNVDTWRKLVPSGERWHGVYVWLPRATDEWAAVS
jgi:hypothetical protein